MVALGHVVRGVSPAVIVEVSWSTIPQHVGRTCNALATMTDLISKSLARTAEYVRAITDADMNTWGVQRTVYPAF